MPKSFDEFIASLDPGKYYGDEHKDMVNKPPVPAPTPEQLEAEARGNADFVSRYNMQKQADPFLQTMGASGIAGAVSPTEMSPMMEAGYQFANDTARGVPRNSDWTRAQGLDIEDPDDDFFDELLFGGY